MYINVKVTVHLESSNFFKLDNKIEYDLIDRFSRMKHYATQI